MASFHSKKELHNSLRVDTQLTRGLAPRRERKAAEVITPGLNVSVNCSINDSTSNASMNRTAREKAPSKTHQKHTGDKKGVNLSRKIYSTGGDRFIPNRSAMQFDVAKYVLSQSGTSNENLSPKTSRYRAAMSENLNGDLSKFRIMAYQKRAPLAPIVQGNEPGASRKRTRYIPQAPQQMLDAPDIVDDYHLNRIDWSSTNYLAVALAENLYIWNASNSDTKLLLELPDPEQYICSVSWLKDTNCLALGLSDGEVQLWDVDAEKKIRAMKTHSARVASLAWNSGNSGILSSGSHRKVRHSDVRISRHHVGTFSGHSLEVCGMAWSPDGKYLASGGNDNVLNIWPSTMTTSRCRPLYVLNDHQDAVKAMSWCPWKSSVLATGGGTGDRHIRFWNCNMGTCLSAMDTKSHVSGILWSNEHRELISGHGYENNELIIWKYPEMTKVAELKGHTSHILDLCLSADGTTVVSAGADETLRLWNCFAVDPKKKKTTASKTKPFGTIR